MRLLSVRLTLTRPDFLTRPPTPILRQHRVKCTPLAYHPRHSSLPRLRVCRACGTTQVIYQFIHLTPENPTYTTPTPEMPELRDFSILPLKFERDFCIGHPQNRWTPLPEAIPSRRISPLSGPFSPLRHNFQPSQVPPANRIVTLVPNPHNPPTIPTTINPPTHTTITPYIADICTTNSR